MARPIRPTPVLDSSNAKIFLDKVERNSGVKVGPVDTPKLAEALKRFSADARKEK